MPACRSILKPLLMLATCIGALAGTAPGLAQAAPSAGHGPGSPAGLGHQAKLARDLADELQPHRPARAHWVRDLAGVRHVQPGHLATWLPCGSGAVRCRPRAWCSARAWCSVNPEQPAQFAQ